MLLRRLSQRLPGALTCSSPILRWTARSATSPPPAAAVRSFQTSQCALRPSDDGTSGNDTGQRWVDDSAAGQQQSASARPSLFEELFPDEKRHTPASNAPDSDSSAASSPPATPPGSDLKKWLHNPYQSSSRPKPFQTPFPTGSTGETPSPASVLNEPTTLILSGAPPSLEPSDLFRLATSQSAHLDGWAGGLVRVSRGYDPATLAPRGRYALSFENRAAALAYLDRARSLHQLGRRTLRAAVKGAETDAALRTFALVPPTGKLDLKMRLGSVIRDGDGAGKDEAVLGVAGAGLDKVGRVSVVLEGPGGGATIGALRDAVVADGKERNLAWKLADGRSSIVPVKWLAAEEGQQPASELGVELGDVLRSLSRLEKKPRPADGEEQTFSRFLLSFRDTVEGRRFVRAWHRKHITSITNGRHIIINAICLW